MPSNLDHYKGSSYRLSDTQYIFSPFRRTQVLLSSLLNG